MGAGYGKEGEDDGIITVNTDRRSERIHPILTQLKALQQVPPILQEGKDPAWKELQQDLRLMNVKETVDIDTQAILRLLEKYQAWCKAHALATVQRQDEVLIQMDEARSASGKVLADVTRCATSTTKIAKQAGLVEDLLSQLTKMEQRVQACTETTKELRVEVLANKQVPAGRQPSLNK